MSENEWIESFEFCVRHQLTHKQVTKLRTQGLPHAVLVNLHLEPIYHIGETDQWMQRNWDYDAGKIRRARTGTGRFADRIVKRGILKVVLDSMGRKSYAVPTEREVLQCRLRALSPQQKGDGFAREGV